MGVKQTVESRVIGLLLFLRDVGLLVLLLAMFPTGVGT